MMADAIKKNMILMEIYFMVHFKNHNTKVKNNNKL